ncbi:Campylobacter invasion antigen B (CiaB) [hydrothermal vent metagenome]|uniref:Campylobacter invasion antigen B (CiaB) n=1 Tax=hydrothermal vent metagenome TaxID=652676 RepID=A0A1W1EHC2_9ZZZZ
MKKKFMNDLQIIYEELTLRQSILNNYFELLNKSHYKAEKLVKEFLEILELKYNSENTLASLNRIINLREDSLNEILKKSNFTEDEIIAKQEEAYLFVSRFHIGEFEKFIIWMRDNRLLNDFYWTIIEGIHAIGISMSGWQSAWTSHIIHGVNKDLYQLFNGDEQKIFKKLEDEQLLDLDCNNNIADRCYSVLRKNHNGSYDTVSYADAFKEEVSSIVDTIDILIESLEEYEDEVFNQKIEWRDYFIALKKAFGHTNTNELIQYWAKVDEKWMAIKSPIQVGHPLEYYEDHYRKAVALEWDLRIINPNMQNSIKVGDNIKDFVSILSKAIVHPNSVKTIQRNIKQIDKTQLYIGQPLFYYGAEFNGLFSAQVVPNDENVSAKFGKKIFAYPDFVIQSKRSKPIMQISVEFLGVDFIRNQKEFIEKYSEIWYKVYNISTIGHEFGHMLWIDEDTEKSMNKSGQFKNIEEFKATAGGLMAFFNNEEEDLKIHIIDDVVSRAISLMSWREVGEVLPYYCEGIIHLDILFESGIINFLNNKIVINYNRYEMMKELYYNAYLKLAKHYLDKRDANIYLSDYAFKYNGIYLPQDERVRSFVEKYYQRYKEIGQLTISIE